MTVFWDQISAIAYRLLHVPVTHDFSRCNVGLWKGDSGKASGPDSERCIVAAIKVRFVIYYSIYHIFVNSVFLKLWIEQQQQALSH